MDQRADKKRQKLEIREQTKINVIKAKDLLYFFTYSSNNYNE